jgi:hypothetical protein
MLANLEETADHQNLEVLVKLRLLPVHQLQVFLSVEKVGYLSKLKGSVFEVHVAG